MSPTDEALARACHELRGPLHAAGLALHAVAREAPAAAVRLRAVETELARVAAVADDLDALRRGVLVAGPRVVRTDVCALVRAQVSAWAAPAERAGRRLVVDAPRVGLLVDVEPGRLAQATGNLLANAVEHGAGDVVARVARARDGGVRIEVRDSGAGLGMPLAELLAGARRRDGGRGRGLAVAEAAARRCGGGLATAPSARGARLVITLPAAVGRAA